MLFGKRVGNYVITSLLGTGGMGEVYVAEHPALGKRVAVKFLSTRAKDEYRLAERFLEEAKAVARIEHPGVVQIFDFGEMDGQLYYVMELLHGRELADIVDERKKLTVAESLTIATQLCYGLHAAHQHGIVHRDLKPSNIFVLEKLPPVVKILDFGIAKILTQSRPHMTVFGQVLGTPCYMSPEQAAGLNDQVSPHSDLYALGIVLYEMLTGQVPFSHSVPALVLAMHLRDDPRPIRAHDPEIPESVAEIVHHCLRKSPAERPESALALARALEAVASAPGAMVQIQTSLQAQLIEEAAATLREGSAPDRDQGPEGASPDPAAADQAKGAPSSAPRRIEIGTYAVTPPLPTGGTVQGRPVTSAAMEPIPKGRDTAEHPSGVTLQSGVAATLHAPQAAALAQGPAPEEALDPPVLRGAGVPPPLPRSSPKEAPAIPGEPVSLSPATLAAPSRKAGDPPPKAGPEILSDGENQALDALLHSLKSHGDFPAFSKNIAEINVHALPNSRASAVDLARVVLKDQSVTTKLLRQVNSAYFRRVAGNVSTVSRAIVLLGFEHVRTTALSMSVFGPRTGPKTPELATSSVRALVCGEIARMLAPMASLKDPEEAFVCAMFRKLGRHMVLHYLPSTHDDITRHMAEHGLDEESAAQAVLGISYEKMGIGVAKAWGFPDRIQVGMLAVPDVIRPARTDGAKLQVLSSFSSEVFEIVNNAPSDKLTMLFERLAKRYEPALKIDPRRIPSIVEAAAKIFSQNYVHLLGASPKSDGFVRVIEKWKHDHSPAAAAGRAQGNRNAPPPSSSAGRHAVQKILEDRLKVVQNSLSRRQPLHEVATLVLDSLRVAFSFHRAMLLVPDKKQEQLRVRVAVGQGTEGWASKLIVPLDKKRPDPFSDAFFQSGVVFAPDLQATHIPLPPWYAEKLGGRALFIHPVATEDRTYGVIYADASEVLEEPTDQELNAVETMLGSLAKALRQVA